MNHKAIYIICLLLCVSCGKKPVQPSTPPIVAHKTSNALTVPNYHKITWIASHWMDDNDNYLEDSTPIEYSVYSTTNFIDVILEQTTINTIVLVTNNYPQQFYLIGAHAK